ncbi:hypothetical protein C8F04DRAFT_1085704 [Mycena alexandri]|uniref:Uncharacterized protein n=1 Tax=Mycena alexandri TaxID=1745969 RepID=A0AAD6X586_9AGAR|nr:hypothetical protein C8F04DRAFT_1085704 [Mycena alexandri]
MKIHVAFAVLSFGSFVAGLASRGGQLSPSPVERSSLMKKETNAERLRRGLSPLPPTRRDKLNPRPSPQPCGPLSSSWGYIAVTESDGGFIGYIRQTFNAQQVYTVTTSKSSALEVTLPSTSPYSGPFNILAVNGQDKRHPYLGAVGGESGYHFSHGHSGSAYLSGTGASPANSPPSSSAGTSMQSIGYKGPAESQIWSMDCKTKVITAQWTNTDSSQPETTIFYDAVEKYLGLTSDLDAFNVGPEDAYGVTFTFVPL